MPFTHKYDRRRFVKTLGAVGVAGALAGCGGGDDTEDTPQETEEPTPTPTETPEPTPTETPEPTPTETEAEDTGGGLESVVASVNDTIDELNNDPDGSITTLNEGLENVEGSAFIDPVEASTPEEAADEAARLRSEAERLRGEIIQKVPEEINIQAGFELVNEDAETVEDLRDDADRIEALSAEAADALRRAAALVEKIESELGAAADQLESVE